MTELVFWNATHKLTSYLTLKPEKTCTPNALQLLGELDLWEEEGEKSQLNLWPCPERLTDTPCVAISLPPAFPQTKQTEAGVNMSRTRCQAFQLLLGRLSVFLCLVSSISFRRWDQVSNPVAHACLLRLISGLKLPAPKAHPSMH